MCDITMRNQIYHVGVENETDETRTVGDLFLIEEKFSENYIEFYEE